MQKTITLLLILLFVSACGNGDEKVTYRLTSKERRLVDTLVTAEVKLMRPRMDSICNLNFEKMVAAATDSIVQERLEDELRLRNRIPLNR